MTVVRVMELVGESKRDWNEAIAHAVKEASTAVPNVTGVEVVNFTANVMNGQIVDYKANVKVAYVEDSR
ncbi:MAG: dodecin family protein [Bacillota bacterium]